MPLSFHLLWLCCLLPHAGPESRVAACDASKCPYFALRLPAACVISAHANGLVMGARMISVLSPLNAAFSVISTNGNGG